MSAHATETHAPLAFSEPVGEYVAHALAGAARVLEAELSDRVTYIHGRTVRGMDERALAERWLTISMDLLDGCRGVLRDEKRYKAQRFGACTVLFDSGHGDAVVSVTRVTEVAA